MGERIGPGTRLPARREAVELRTADGLRLVGELALPADREPRATVVLLHPNPLGGGCMDTHVIRKAAFRLPALAGLATLRFDTRGTRGSEGTHDHGDAERHDVAAALDHVAHLPEIWLAGWSFGTDLVLMHGLDPRVRGAVLMAPSLLRTRPEHLAAWAESGRPLRCLVPELDDYVRPEQARERFAVVRQAEVITLPGARHLLVGHAEAVLDALVGLVAPEVPTPLPRVW